MGADIQDCNSSPSFTRTNTRLTFTAPDGTEYNLIDREKGGTPRNDTCSFNVSGYRGNVFLTADGTTATFYSSALIEDQYSAGDPEYTNAQHEVSPSGYLMLRDGTRYDIVNGEVTRMRDRNGNETRYEDILSYGTYGNGNGFYYVSGRIITDSLKRQIVINYDVNEGTTYGTCDRITLKGFGGADRIVRVSYTSAYHASHRSDHGVELGANVSAIG